jgi:hypothetical protein
MSSFKEDPVLPVREMPLTIGIVNSAEDLS